MLEAFTGQTANCDIENKLHSLKQKASETVFDYCSKAVKLVRRLNYENRETESAIIMGDLAWTTEARQHHNKRS